MNRLEPRFEIIAGVVDTDTYINLINFPFILHKRDKQFLIKKGGCISFKNNTREPKNLNF